MTGSDPLDAPVAVTPALTASTTAAGTPLRHHWSSCVGAGRAAEGLRAGWRRQLAEAVEAAGFRYVRFHGLFHDDMFVVTRAEDGSLNLNFQYVDDLVDALLATGIRPFVELAFSPRALAREVDTVFWWRGHGAPPTDLSEWSTVVTRLVLHWIDRYGRDEVRRWYFEVWNEPNLRPFFAGTRSEYFQLYEATARAVKAVDGALRVGGPATSNFVPDTRFDGETEDFGAHESTLAAPDLDGLEWRPVWVRQFLEFCAAGEVPVDFISVHPYPTDWALDEHGTGRRLTRGVDATPQDLRTVREVMAAAGRPDLELHVTEWSSSSSSRDFTHDFLQAATYVARTALATIGLTDSLSYWTFTDVFEEQGAGSSPLHGGFGMVTLQGVPKPVWHAFRMLHSLGDELIAQTPDGVLTRAADGRIRALVHHYPEQEPRSVPASFGSRDVAWSTWSLGEDRATQIRIDGLEPGARFLVETLDRSHGDLMAAWTALGEPETWDRPTTAALDLLARATDVRGVVADTQGVLELELVMSPWSLVLLQQL